MRKRGQEEKGATNSAPRSMSFVTVGKARQCSFMLSFSTFVGTRFVEFSKAPPLLVLACSEKQYRDLLLDW